MIEQVVFFISNDLNAWDIDFVLYQFSSANSLHANIYIRHFAFIQKPKFPLELAFWAVAECAV